MAFLWKCIWGRDLQTWHSNFQKIDKFWTKKTIFFQKNSHFLGQKIKLFSEEYFSLQVVISRFWKNIFKNKMVFFTKKSENFLPKKVKIFYQKKWKFFTKKSAKFFSKTESFLVEFSVEFLLNFQLKFL